MFSEQGLSFWWVWLMYIGVGLMVLGLLYYPMRQRSHWLHLILLTPIAALMFAPLTVQPESEYWGPAVLIMLFEAEKGGAEALIRGLIPLILTFLVFLCLGIALLLQPKIFKQKSTGDKPEPSDKTEPDINAKQSNKHSIVDELTLD